MLKSIQVLVTYCHPSLAFFDFFFCYYSWINLDQNRRYQATNPNAASATANPTGDQENQSSQKIPQSQQTHTNGVLLKASQKDLECKYPTFRCKKNKLKTYKHSILTSLTYLTKLIWGSTYTAKKELVGLSFGHMGLGFETVPTKIFKSRQKKRTMEKPINYL